MNSVEINKEKIFQIILEKGNDTIWGRLEFEDLLIVQEGKNVQEVIDGIKIQLRDAESEDDNLNIFLKTVDFEEVEFTFAYDLSQFFKEFDVLKISTFAKICEINPSLMRKYVSGIHYPSEKQLKKIQEGLSILVNNLSNIKLI
ncbi:hypothetical protein QM480_01710 [Flectobacillus sp. DC10W]|uniref:XRE family transcriptional regulator n=1 Tax=Flectobacillus longus TaxID=2984207 RepID=A0ABT6YHH8_9BACT|nr:hypothetical protein [Flectobacillus longus]MDI9863025.1 hypothetical protein [Flectobacillus longus]